MKYIYTKEENKAYFRSEMESMKGIMKGVTYDSETGDTVLPPVEEMNENQLKLYKKADGTSNEQPGEQVTLTSPVSYVSYYVDAVGVGGGCLSPGPEPKGRTQLPMIESSFFNIFNITIH